MLTNAMGIILADHHRVDLAEITAARALAAVPFAGRFRIVDFMLSNMVNSGIKNVGVLALTKYKSLMDHLGTGSFWDLDRMQQGLTIIPPFVVSSSGRPGQEDLTGLFEFLSAGREDYVVISNGNLILNIKLDEIVEAHADSRADMTILYNHDIGNPHNNVSLFLDDGYVDDVLVGTPDPKTDVSSIGIMVISRKLLVELVSETMARGESGFSIETLLKKYPTYRIRAQEYPDLCLDIDCLASFFAANLRMLDPEVRDHLFNQEDRPIYTKVKNESPAFYEKGSFVSNSLISDGCSVYGSVSNCILFRDVHVGRHANLHDCVIFQDSYIAEGADLSCVILDKNTMVNAGVKLQGATAYPVVIRKNARV